MRSARVAIPAVMPTQEAAIERGSIGSIEDFFDVMQIARYLPALL